jgi:hypothetical protein
VQGESKNRGKGREAEWIFLEKPFKKNGLFGDFLAIIARIMRFSRQDARDGE